MDYDAMKFWGDWAQWGITMALAFYVWVTNRHRVTQDKLVAIGQRINDEVDKLKDCELKTMESRVEDHKDRLIKIEQNMEHLPSQRDFMNLSTKMDDLNGNLQYLTGRLDGINRLADLVNKHLIEKK